MAKVESVEHPTGGVKVIQIAGRHIHEKERMAGMTAEDRIWRQKWLKDQCLTPREPTLIQKNSPDLMNPIRRFYRAPLDIIFHKVLQPVIGADAAVTFRFYTGRIFIGIWAAYATFYYFKYNTNNWEKVGGWRVIRSRTVTLPGEPCYPKGQEKTKGDDYADRGFKSSIFSKVVDCPTGPRGFW